MTYQRKVTDLRKQGFYDERFSYGALFSSSFNRLYNCGVPYAYRNVMKIDVQVNDPVIRQAATLFMKHYNDPTFLNKVSCSPYFYHTEHSPEAVAHSIQFLGESMEMVIKSYKPLNPWTKAIAYAEGNTIYFNSRKRLGLLDRVETICHEFLHLCGYSHDGNFVTAYNLKTVPYKVANIFKDHVKEILESHP